MRKKQSLRKKDLIYKVKNLFLYISIILYTLILNDEIHGQNLYNDSLISSYLLDDVRLIAFDNTVYSRSIGIVGDENSRNIPCKKIQESASNENLKTLTFHPSPAVRCCALYGLLTKKSNYFFDVLDRFSEDTKTFNNQCIGLTPTLQVVDYLYFNLSVDKLQKEFGYHLNRLQKKKIKKAKRKAKKIVSDIYR